MSIFIRILLVVGAIVLLAFMLRKIRLAKLKIEYTVFWIGFSCILVIMGVFPQIMSAISEFLGFKSTVNMVYLIVIFVLIVKLFYNTIQISAPSEAPRPYPMVPSPPEVRSVLGSVYL